MSKPWSWADDLYRRFPRKKRRGGRRRARMLRHYIDAVFDSITEDPDPWGYKPNIYPCPHCGLLNDPMSATTVHRFGCPFAAPLPEKE